MIAISSDKALVRAGAMKNATKAEKIFDLFGTELESAGNGSVDLAVLTLTR